MAVSATLIQMQRLRGQKSAAAKARQRERRWLRAQEQQSAERERTPAPPPRYYSGPPIPRSVIWHILNHLRDHTSTLARCMRVSPDFHAIAVPLLYSVVNLPSFVLCRCPPDDITNGVCWRHPPHPLAFVPSTGSQEQQRVTEPKAVSLEKIRGIVLDGHTPADCGKYMDDLALLDPSSLRPRWIRLNYLSNDRIQCINTLTTIYS